MGYTPDTKMDSIIHKSIEQKSDAWFNLRGKKMVTSSDMATFFGLNGEAARKRHFKDKTGAIPEFWGNDATAWGNYAEPRAAQDINKLYACRDDVSFDFDVGFVEPPTYKKLHGIVGSSPDGIKTEERPSYIYDSEHVRFKLAVEIKCPSSLNVPARDKIPWAYLLQCYQHMYCLNVDTAMLYYWTPYFRGDHVSRIRTFKIYRDPVWEEFYENVAYNAYQLYWSKGVIPPRSELHVDDHRKLLKRCLASWTLDLGWYYPNDGIPCSSGDTASDDESEPEH